MKLNNNLTSVFFMLLAATFVAFGSFARKCLVNNGGGTYDAVFIYFVGGSMIMWWVVSISSFNKILPQEWKPILIRVVFGFFAQFFFFIGLSKGSILLVILLFNTSPLFVPVIRFVFLNARLSLFNCIYIAVGFVGIYLVLGVNGTEGLNIYSLSAIFAAILNAGSQVVLHKASQKEDLFVMNLWIYTFIALLLVLFLPFNLSSLIEFKNFDTPLLLWSCLAMIIFGVSSQIFRVKAFKFTKDPTFVAPAMYFSIVVAAILDALVYKTTLTYVEVCGIVIICFSSILSIVKKSHL